MGGGVRPPPCCPLWSGDVPSLDASVYHREKRGPQMGQQATLCSPFANFNMVSVCVGMALGTVATPPPLSSPSPISPLCPFDLALNHKQTTHTHTHTYAHSYWLCKKLYTNHICFSHHERSSDTFLSRTVRQLYSFRCSVLGVLSFLRVASPKVPLTLWVRTRCRGCRCLTSVNTFSVQQWDSSLLSLCSES